MTRLFAKDKIAKRHFIPIVQEASFWSLQLDGTLEDGEEIEILLVGDDEADSVTGKDGSANQSLTDDDGVAITITADTPNPLGFYRPARVTVSKPVTINDTTILLLSHGA